MRTEQLESGDDNAELTKARVTFESYAKNMPEQPTEPGLNQLRFALELLDARNTAMTPTRGSAAAAELDAPMAHFWNACSHNSYAAGTRTRAVGFTQFETSNDRCSDPCATDIVGDQLTGLSSADAYRRQLLQVSRAARTAIITAVMFVSSLNLTRVASQCWKISGL